MGHEKVQALLAGFVLDLPPVAAQKGDGAIRHVLALGRRGFSDYVAAVLLAGGNWTVLPTLHSDHEHAGVTIEKVLSGERWVAAWDPLELGVRLFEQAGEVTPEEAADWRRWHEARRDRQDAECWEEGVRRAAERYGLEVTFRRKGGE